VTADHWQVPSSGNCPLFLTVRSSSWPTAWPAPSEISASWSGRPGFARALRRTSPGEARPPKIEPCGRQGPWRVRRSRGAR